MGEHEHQIAKMAARANRPLPEKIANAPSLNIGNELYMVSFMDLSTCRQSPYGAMPISYFDMVNYAMINDFDSEQLELLLRVIPDMDAKYLKIMDKKQKVKTTPKRGKK